MSKTFTNFSIPANYRFQSLKSAPIPIITTSVFSDITLFFALLPVWWFLGIEQIIWLFLFALTTIKTLVLHRFRVRVVTAAKILVFFLIIHLVSSLSIVESFRIITFIRNFSMYLLALFIVITITNNVRTEEQLQRVIDGLLVGIGWAVILGFLGIIGLFRPEFTSGIGYLLPSSISSTDYGTRIVLRSTGTLSWFAGLGTYYRIRSVFLYGTMYATTLAMTYPLLLYRFRISETLKGRLILVILGCLMLINLLFTTGRSAIAAWLIGAVVWLWFTYGLSKRWGKLVLLLLMLMACILIVAFLVSIFLGLDPFQLTEANLRSLLAARGSSTADRLYVYQQTLIGWLDRPLIGWGTERDIPGFRYPAGSHSYYLGTLYKQGIIGLAIFVLLLSNLWQSTSPGNVRRRLQWKPKILLQLGRWSLAVYILNGFTDVLDLDASTMTFSWIILALLLTAANCQLHSSVSQLSRDSDPLKSGRNPHFESVPIGRSSFKAHAATTFLHFSDF